MLYCRVESQYFTRRITFPNYKFYKACTDKVYSDETEENAVRAFLSILELKGLTKEIAEETVKVRKVHRIKVPDAIVYATARIENCLIVTRNSKDLKPEWTDVRVPYRI